MSPSHQIRLSVLLYTHVFAVHTTDWGSLVGGRFGVTLCSPGNNSPSYKFSVENKARKKVKREASLRPAAKCHRGGTLTDNSNL